MKNITVLITLSQKMKSFVILLILLAVIPATAVADESITAVKIKRFADSIIANLESKAPKNTTIAITDFDNKSGEAARKNLGFAMSELITEQFQKSGKFRLIEKKQINRIISSLEMGITGLYDSDKASSIGKLIDTKYLLLGSVSMLSGFYRVSVRAVEVETGTIILTESIDLESELLEDTAKKYQPPRYRVHIGSSMNWFSDKYSDGDYSIGLSMGWHYNVAGPHWATLQGIYYFGHWYDYFNKSINQNEAVESNHTLKSTFIFQAGYGYRIPLSRNVSFQPNIFAGVLAGRLDEYGNYYNSMTTEEGFRDRTRLYYTGIIQPRLDLIFMEKSPVSFYIGTGYFYYTSKFSDDFHGRKIDRYIQGIKLEGAIMAHL